MGKSGAKRQLRTGWRTGPSGPGRSGSGPTRAGRSRYPHPLPEGGADLRRERQTVNVEPIVGWRRSRLGARRDKRGAGRPARGPAGGQRPTMETRVPQKADEDSSAPVISGTGNAEISNQFVVFWLGAWNVRAWTGTGRETRPGRHRAGQFVLSGKNGRSSLGSGPRFRSFRSRTNRPARRRPGRVARPARPAAGASAWQTERRKDRRLAGPWRRSACRRVSGGGGSS